MMKQHASLAVIGAVVGLAVGYAIFASTYPLPYGFIEWLSDTHANRLADALLWTTLGAIVGGAVAYIRKH